MLSLLYTPHASLLALGIFTRCTIMKKSIFKNKCLQIRRTSSYRPHTLIWPLNKNKSVLFVNKLRAFVLFSMCISESVLLPSALCGWMGVFSRSRLHVCTWGFYTEECQLFPPSVLAVYLAANYYCFSKKYMVRWCIVVVSKVNVHVTLHVHWVLYMF